MLRICRRCAVQYEGTHGSTLCPSCTAAAKKNVIRDRTCRECGATFAGGPRAWYCPSCRKERQRITSQKLRRSGPARPLGSTDTCTVCGGEYTVTCGNQRYCPACADGAVRAVDRVQALEWYAKNGDPAKRRELRQEGTATNNCRVCGKPFVPRYANTTCSAECKAEMRRRTQQQYEVAHREEINAAQRRRYKRKKEDVP